MPAPKPAFATKRAVIPQFLDQAEAEKLRQVIQARISQRAFALYEESGRQSGNDEKNWLQAKLQILQSLECKESGSWVAFTASIPDGLPESIQISVDRTRVVVRADRDAQGSEVFFASELSAEVEPTTATASFKDQTLHLMVRKHRPGNSASPINGSATRRD